MSIKRRIGILADLSQFPSGRWVHYTDAEVLHINLPKRNLGGPFHQDVAGIYFFPAEFKPWPNWLEKKYKYTARLKPGTRILDLAHLGQEELEQILKAAGDYTVRPWKGDKPGTPYQQSIYQMYLDDTKRYPPENLTKRIDMAWGILRNTLGVNRLTARWNKILRAAGYEAIFDDTKAVHSNESQLIVLDPRVLTQITKEYNKRSAFKGMQQVLQDVAHMAKQRYGVAVEIQPPRRDNKYHMTPQNMIARIELKRSENNYVNFNLYYDASRINIVNLSLSWADPKPNYGVGLIYNFAAGAYEFDGLNGLAKELDKIFTPPSTASTESVMNIVERIRPIFSALNEDHSPHHDLFTRHEFDHTANSHHGKVLTHSYYTRPEGYTKKPLAERMRAVKQGLRAAGYKHHKQGADHHYTKPGESVVIRKGWQIHHARTVE